MITYLFRKFSDPCWQTCLQKFGKPTERSMCKYECHVTAANNIVADIRSEINRCNDQPNPKRCEKALQSHLIKWSKKLQGERIKLRLAKVKHDVKERQTRVKDRETRDNERTD